MKNLTIKNLDVLYSISTTLADKIKDHIEALPEVGSLDTSRKQVALYQLELPKYQKSKMLIDALIRKNWTLQDHTAELVRKYIELTSTVTLEEYERVFNFEEGEGSESSLSSNELKFGASLKGSLLMGEDPEEVCMNLGIDSVFSDFLRDWKEGSLSVINLLNEEGLEKVFKDLSDISKGLEGSLQEDSN